MDSSKCAKSALKDAIRLYKSEPKTEVNRIDAILAKVYLKFIFYFLEGSPGLLEQ